MTELPPMSDFRAWVGGKAPNEIIGERQWDCSCPIANWLEYATGMGVSVGACEIAIYPHDLATPAKSIDTPKWVQEFIRAVDTAAGRPYVRARDALAILDEINQQVTQ